MTLMYETANIYMNSSPKRNYSSNFCADLYRLNISSESQVQVNSVLTEMPKLRALQHNLFSIAFLPSVAGVALQESSLPIHHLPLRARSG